MIMITLLLISSLAMLFYLRNGKYGIERSELITFRNLLTVSVALYCVSVVMNLIWGESKVTDIINLLVILSIGSSDFYIFRKAYKQ